MNMKYATVYSRLGERHEIMEWKRSTYLASWLGVVLSEIVRRVNDLLHMACTAEDFAYMNQDDIKLAHISSDGVHLNSHGSAIIMFNVFSVFNSFDSNFIDFKEDYDYAISLGWHDDEGGILDGKDTLTGSNGIKNQGKSDPEEVQSTSFPPYCQENVKVHYQKKGILAGDTSFSTPVKLNETGYAEISAMAVKVTSEIVHEDCVQLISEVVDYNDTSLQRNERLENADNAILIPIASTFQGSHTST